MAKTAAERAQQTVDRIDERIGRLTERRDAAVAKVAAKYEQELAQLTEERQHAASAPALQAATA